MLSATISIRSIAGEGVSFIIKIPLTLAIVSALIVEAGGERFAIPQLSVSELVKLRIDGEQRIEYIKDTAVLRLRDRLLPVAKLTTLLGLDTSRTLNSGFIVVIEFGSQCFGIVVDSVFHTEEVVVKPMSSKLRNIAMFSGNTILGDGAVIMIIDPNGVVQSIGATVATQLAAAEAVAAKDQPSTAAQAVTSLLLFRAGSSQQKAVPLSLITRLEEIDVETIELSNGRHMVQYRGHLMPLVGLGSGVRVKGEGTQPLLVFSDGSRSMALLVDDIVDIVEERLDIEAASASPGVLGSAIIKGQATEIVDVGHFVPEAFADWFRGTERPARAAKPSVLLVDDSPFYRNMLMPVLQAAGYDVTAVARAAEALDLIDKGRTFNAVVTDIEMPEMDGFAFAEHLRADERTAALPVVALSAVVTADSVERGRAAGFDDYVAKFDRPGLIAALKEQIDMSAAA
jgi:two-component system chemotaxis sensor kinase CheA